MLARRQQEIHAERDRKLEAARQQRKTRRQQAVMHKKSAPQAPAAGDRPRAAEGALNLNFRLADVRGGLG
jgi:hypothetical protein